MQELSIEYLESIHRVKVPKKKSKQEIQVVRKE